MNALIAALAHRAPVDVVIEEPGSVMTAGRLLAEIKLLRMKLVKEGIDRFGLLAGNSAAWVVADLAAQMSDRNTVMAKESSRADCILPLPVFFSDEQILNSILGVGLDAVLTDDPQRLLHILQDEQIEILPGEVGGLTILRLDNRAPQVLPTGTRKITFTSGSTGSPRGVCLGNDQQIRVAEALDEVLQLDAPRHLCLLPLSTLLENICGVYYPLLTGGSVIIPPDTDTGFSGSTGLDMRRMLGTIVRHRPTSIILLPQMLVGLVAALEDGWQVPAELKFAAVGGGKVATSLLSRARELGLPVFEGYGLSETASVACLNHPAADRAGSAGRPLSHIDVTVEDDEIIVSGNSFLGYVGEPQSWGQQCVATGDLGQLDADGYVYLDGRKKNVLISSFGRNISPEWIESELLRNPEIQQCIVFGDDRPYCTALIAVQETVAVLSDVQSLIDAVNAKLPDYARILRWHRLPRKLGDKDGLYTDNGRPRRALIAERYGAVIDALYFDSLDTEPARSASR
jgi:long-chain acyl-CoA synthetase